MRQEQEMGEPTPPFTRGDIEIEYWTAEWGAPCAYITVKRPGSWYDGQRYGLRSSKGLEHATRREHWHYLVDKESPWSQASGPTARRGEFLGSMGTANLEKAIDGLLADFTKWDNDQRDQSQIARQVAELAEALRELDEWNPLRTEMTLRSRWPRARDLFLQIEMALFEPPAVPDPPEWMWHGRVALLDRPAKDGRVMRSSGRYDLRAGAAPMRVEGQSHPFGESIGCVCYLRADLQEGNSTLWAYGTAIDRNIARQLNSGQLFASIALVESAEYERGESFWQGGTVYSAVALPASQWPWES